MERPNVQIQGAINANNIIAKGKKQHISRKIKQKTGVYPEHRILLQPLDFHLQNSSVTPGEAKHDHQQTFQASGVCIEGIGVLQKYRVERREYREPYTYPQKCSFRNNTSKYLAVKPNNTGKLHWRVEVQEPEIILFMRAQVRGGQLDEPAQKDIASY